MGMAKVSYNAADIEVLEGLEPVRKRPGMYIAGTDTPAGLHQLVSEILDNSVDEAMNGHADKIIVTLHRDGQSVTVEDNGRGIPVDKHPKFKRPALEVILTTLHAGGKFSDKNYKSAGGLHGVGSSVVNALSVEMVATIKRDGKEYQQSYSRGLPQTGVKVISDKARGTGTKIFFRPDDEIFPKIDFSAKRIRESIQTKAYLNPGLRLIFIDEQEKTQEEFFYADGLGAYLRQLLDERKAKVVGDEPFILQRNDEVLVNISLAWTDATSEQFYSYVNGIYTADGGTHELGAKAGIVKALRNYIGTHDLEPKGVKISAEDIREGLLALVSIKLPGDKYQPQFQGQTKSKLNNPEVSPLVESAARLLEQSLNEKPSAAQAIVNRIILAAKARAASREASQNVRRKLGISHRLTLPGKLADCSSVKTEETELFIVEGDSAGGSAKQGRSREFQAVLPLRGKVLNTISNASKKATDNKELANIVSALGCGAGNEIALERLRYGKTVILTDADADGMHIATLLLAFFFKFMRPLIEQGHLYIGKPPLYGIYPKGSQATALKKSRAKATKGSDKGADSSKSPSAHWAYSEYELNQLIAKHKLNGPRIVRYKGLGEMNPETLWETTLDPERRTLLRVSIDDEAAVDASFEALMGSDPSTRYQMITDNAEGIEVDV